MNTINILQLNTLALKDVIHLRASAMEDNGVEAQSVEEVKAESKLIEVIEDCTTNFDDSKFCGLG